MAIKGEVKDSLKHGTWQSRRVGKAKVIEVEEFKSGRFVSGQAFLSSDPSNPGRMFQEMMEKFPDDYAWLFDNLESLKLDEKVFHDSVRYLEPQKFIKTIFGVDHQIQYRDAGYRFGESKLMQHIARNIRYPGLARAKGYAGVVIVQLTITADNQAKDFKILKGQYDVLNEEALRVIRSAEHWVSAIHEGKPYEKTIAIPVRFML